ncbi:MAG: tagaturonate reductase [Bacteroidota bacterium]
MKLSKENLASVNAVSNLQFPDAAIFNLPEKILQFGTGVLLRGLPDYFIDKANKQGIFNGRIVVVKSTSQGSSDAFTDQDGLYTLSVKGFDNGTVVDKYILNASISRVISANDSWEEVLSCAENADMRIVISNTTEAGIVLVEDDIFDSPPVSFPGKLLSFLYRRYQHFNGAADAGMIILPTELITSNGAKLKEILLALSEQNKLDADFILWLTNANDFCNTLVDRIVPGALSANDKVVAEKELGYIDDLLIMSEVYSLWAIETQSQKVREQLSFAKADAGVVITANINKFKELKLRLLNGSHTFTCGLALIQGFTTVKEAMANEGFYAFISSLMFDEIVPSVITEAISETDAKAFAVSVLDRYRNPFIEHKWLSITLQYSMKMNMRNVESIKRYYDKFNKVPQNMTMGFAAYIVFMKSTKNEAGEYAGYLNGKQYVISDQFAPVLHDKYVKFSDLELVQQVLCDKELWSVDLSAVPGFVEAVYDNMKLLQSKSEAAVL